MPKIIITKPVVTKEENEKRKALLYAILTEIVYKNCK